MKKTLVSALLAVFSIWASAAPVTKHQAEAYAQKFFKTGRLSEVITSDMLFPSRSNDGCPSFYIINNNSGGWVILSGEDCTFPVLAYSDQGSISLSGFPSSTGAWLSGIDEGIGKIRESGLKQGALAMQKWSEIGVRTKSGSGGKMLETAEWSQGEPFNNLCPMDGRVRTLAGCVATAMAIILRYHKWPEHGRGELDSYTTETSGINVSGFSLEDHLYNWDEMPLEYSSSSTATQKKEVAQLMYDCGVMVRMDYSRTASAALSSAIIPALAEHMYYSSLARELYRSNYSDNEWLRMIKAEIDAGRPLLYGGSDKESQAGHQFVCDGYDDSGFIHINWGWSGFCNGYYAVSFLGDRDEEKVNYVFNHNDSAIFGLAPDPDAPSEYSTELYLYVPDSGDYRGIQLKNGEPGKGKDFSISIGKIFNDSFISGYDGAFKAALVSRDGAVREFIGKEETLQVNAAKAGPSSSYTPGQTSISEYNCHIDGDVTPGDVIAIYYKLPDGVWARMGGAPLGAYDACFINVPAEFIQGKVYYPELIPGWKTIKEVSYYYDNFLCDKGYVTLSSGTHEIKACVVFLDGSTETVIQKFTVN